MALSPVDIIEAKYLPAFLLMNPNEQRDFYQIPKDMSLDEVENKIIKLTFQRTGGNKTKAAKLLNIGLRTLQRKVKAQM